MDPKKIGLKFEIILSMIGTQLAPAMQKFKQTNAASRKIVMNWSRFASFLNAWSFSTPQSLVRNQCKRIQHVRSISLTMIGTLDLGQPRTCGCSIDKLPADLNQCLGRT